MSKLVGVFELLKDLEKIPPENIYRWLVKPQIDQKRIADFVGNRIYYPQTVSLDEKEMEIDLAILKESLKFNKDLFISAGVAGESIFIPDNFIKRFFPLNQLIKAFLDGLKLENVTQIMIEQEGKKVIVGSVYTQSSKETLEATLDNTQITLKANSINFFPLNTKQSILSIGDKKITIFGGSLGLVTDLREKIWIS